jgi:hypothetical protein
MVCFRYIIVNILHAGDNYGNNNNNNNNNNNKSEGTTENSHTGHCTHTS